MAAGATQPGSPAGPSGSVARSEAARPARGPWTAPAARGAADGAARRRPLPSQARATEPPSGIVSESTPVVA